MSLRDFVISRSSFQRQRSRESLDSGLYVRRRLPVQFGSGRASALVYIARWREKGTPRPGYIGLVVDAARDWGLPDAYIRSLRRWSPSRWRGARTKASGELG